MSPDLPSLTIFGYLCIKIRETNGMCVLSYDIPRESDMFKVLFWKHFLMVLTLQRADLVDYFRDVDYDDSSDPMRYQIDGTRLHAKTIRKGSGVLVRDLLPILGMQGLNTILLHIGREDKDTTVKIQELCDFFSRTIMEFYLAASSVLVRT